MSDKEKCECKECGFFGSIRQCLDTGIAGTLLCSERHCQYKAGLEQGAAKNGDYLVDVYLDYSRAEVSHFSAAIVRAWKEGKRLNDKLKQSQ